MKIPTRAKLLASWATERRWTTGAELGVLDGRTFMHLLKSCPDLYMVGVDLWHAQPEKETRRDEGGRSYEQFDLHGMFSALCEKVAPYSARAQLLRTDTVSAAFMFPDGHFDFVFIDADHTYEGVRDDIRAWRPKVKPGGWLIGHDWNERDFPGVIQAVRELLGEPGVHPDNVWAVRV